MSINQKQKTIIIQQKLQKTKIMKKVKIFTLSFLLFALTISLNSCQKIEVDDSTPDANILSFKSLEELETTIE